MPAAAVAVRNRASLSRSACKATMCSVRSVIVMNTTGVPPGVVVVPPL